jgi:hypothetical protein
VWRVVPCFVHIDLPSSVPLTPLMTSRRSLNKAQAQTTTKRNSGPIAKNHVGKKAYSVAYGVMSPLQTALSYALVVRVERGLSL